MHHGFPVDSRLSGVILVYESDLGDRHRWVKLEQDQPPWAVVLRNLGIAICGNDEHVSTGNAVGRPLILDWIVKVIVAHSDTAWVLLVGRTQVKIIAAGIGGVKDHR